MEQEPSGGEEVYRPIALPERYEVVRAAVQPASIYGYELVPDKEPEIAPFIGYPVPPVTERSPHRSRRLHPALVGGLAVVTALGAWQIAEREGNQAHHPTAVQTSPHHKHTLPLSRSTPSATVSPSVGSLPLPSIRPTTPATPSESSPAPSSTPPPTPSETVAPPTIQTQLDGTTGGSRFRIASYNMRVASDSAENATAVHNMERYRFTIVGMQELQRPAIFRSVKSKLTHAGYDIYPKKYISQFGLSATAIAWDTSRFDFVKASSVEYTSGNRHVGRLASHSPIVWLRDKQTGQELIVMNIHNYAFAAGPRREAARHYTKEIASLQAENLPIFFTGDFNEGYGPSGTAYCMLEQHRLMVSPSVATPVHYCKPGGVTGEIDHILTSKGISGTIHRLVGRGAKDPHSNDFANLGTDHHEVPYADIVIPKNR